MGLLSKYRHQIALLLIGVCMGAAALYAVGFRNHVDNTSRVVNRLGGYHLINPLLSCDISEDTPSVALASLQFAFEAVSRDLVRSGEITRMSVYFRDMDYGNWTGVNENDLFAPASLMKVPLMIAYLSEARTNPGILSTPYALSVPSNLNDSESFRPQHPLSIGQTYTTQELISAMIEESDNNATAVLLKHVPGTAFADVFDAFGVPAVSDQNADAISPKQYMRFFRIVYNSTYLGRTRSAAALQMLTEVDFPAGLQAGLPKGTPLANKFGERTVSTASGQLIKRQLSDCGIVYYPRSPYGICVMVEGDDFDSLSEAITEISRIAYKQVSKGLLKRD